MPYVIQNKKGLYLRRVSGYSSANRSWVAKIDEATIWDKSGSAKNAARFAIKGKSEELFLQEVKLMCWGTPTVIEAKNYNR